MARQKYAVQCAVQKKKKNFSSIPRYSQKKIELNLVSYGQTDRRTHILNSSYRFVTTTAKNDRESSKGKLND